MTQGDVATEAGVAQSEVSKYEHGRTVPAPAVKKLEAWVEKHRHAGEAAT